MRFDCLAAGVFYDGRNDDVDWIGFWIGIKISGFDFIDSPCSVSVMKRLHCGLPLHLPHPSPPPIPNPFQLIITQLVKSINIYSIVSNYLRGGAGRCLCVPVEELTEPVARWRWVPVICDAGLVEMLRCSPPSTLSPPFPPPHLPLLGIARHLAEVRPRFIATESILVAGSGPRSTNCGR